MAVNFSGSLVITGSLITTGTIVMSGSIASASYAQNAITSQTSSYADSFTVGGTLTAQTLVVQTITSSVDFVTGSTRFGSTIGNTHVFTGSIQITSGSINNAVYSGGSNYKQWTIGDFTYGTNYNTFELRAGTEPRMYLNTDGGGNAVLYNSYGNVGLSYSSGSYSNDILYYDHYYGGKSLSIGAGGSTRMFISGSGNVGIGTISPSKPLYIVGGNGFSGTQLAISASGDSAGIQLLPSPGGVIYEMQSTTAGQYIIYDRTNSAYRMVIASGSGNVGINTSSPGRTLSIGSTSGTGTGVSPSTIEAIQLGQQFGTGTIGTNFKHILFKADGLSDTYRYGFGISEYLFEMMAGTGGSIAFFTNGGTERMRINSSGNVGIGTSTPSYMLDVVKADVNTIRIQNTGNNSDAYLQVQNTGGNALFGINATGPYIYTSTALALQLYTNNSERIRITSAGNVGIGLTNPQSQLHINGDFTFTESGYDTVRKHQIAHSHSDGSSPNNYLSFKVSDGSGTTAERMRINGNGHLTLPYQPAFFAYAPNGGSNTRTAGAFGGYSLTRVNRGSHYNTSNGRFTAPIAGVYEFIFSMLWRQSSDTASGEISIGVNGANISGRGMAYTYSGAANDFHDQTFVRVILSLSAGDYVTGWIHSSGASTGNWYYGDGLGHFSGYLLG